MLIIYYSKEENRVPFNFHLEDKDKKDGTKRDELKMATTTY